jgi:DNA-binding transcriptional MerR regulator
MYTYSELAEQINKHLRAKGKVTDRTLRFWVTIKLLPPPHGGSRWRYFTEDAVQKALEIREQQRIRKQTIRKIQAMLKAAKAIRNNDYSKLRALANDLFST